MDPSVKRGVDEVAREREEGRSADIDVDVGTGGQATVLIRGAMCVNLRLFRHS